MKTLLLSLFTATCFVASGASACDEHKAKATDQTATSVKDCCAKTEAASACNHSKETAGSASGEPACPHARKALTTAKAGGSCPFMDAKLAVTAEAVKTSEVKLTGRLLCEHCNLHKAESCKPVFQAEGESDYVPASGAELEAVRSASDHGKNLLAIEGKLSEDGQGSKVLEITTWNKVEEPRS